MNAIVRALSKERDVVEKEIASLRHLIFDDHPEMDLLKLHEEFQALLDRFPPAIRATEVEFVRSFDLFHRRESEIRKRLRKKMKFDPNAAMTRLCALECDLSDLVSQLYFQSRR